MNDSAGAFEDRVAWPSYVDFLSTFIFVLIVDPQVPEGGSLPN